MNALPKFDTSVLKRIEKNHKPKTDLIKNKEKK